MSEFTEAARQAIGEIAARHGVSIDAVEQMARAVAQGGGTMAQFHIPELGGGGQWMAGGMIMVGDMFDHGLKARVAGLCADLSDAQARMVFFTPIEPAPGSLGGSSWWPASLGAPAASGGQNSLRYAYFPGARRLAVDLGEGGPVRVFDTLDHAIGGFSQQQSGVGGDPLAGVTFSSQFGQFALASLPPAPEFAAPAPAPAPSPAPAPATPPESARAPEPALAESPPHALAAPAPTAPEAAQARGAEPAATGAAPAPQDAETLLATIERLAALRDQGALTEAEFAEKKRELLARL